jgi:hypothetical protein
MIYVIYFFASGFAVIAAMMYFAWYRTRHFGLFVLATTYAVSSLLAFSVLHWWPLVTGFVLVWVLKYLGLEPKVEFENEDGTSGDEGGGMRTEDKKPE